MKEINNPFDINSYSGPDFFCDREQETAALLQHIKTQRHTAFFALRRLGKTALIQHVFYLAGKQKNKKCIYIDIYASQHLKDFSNMLANHIYTVFPQHKGIGKKFWEAIKLFRPVVSVDPLSGNPELSLDISQPKQFEKTIPQLLQFLDQQPIKTVIAIDEFQQILNYPEKNVEAILRTAMQGLKNVTFIFCGSNQAMMQQIFNSAKRPFYASCTSINLQQIPEAAYLPFIKNTFNRHRIKISEEAAAEILNFTKVHTYYTQCLCHELFNMGIKNILPAHVQAAKLKLIQEREGTFFQYRNLLTSTQWQLLKAIAKQETVTQPYGKDFIGQYRLGSAAIVKRSLEALLQKEMIYYNSSIATPNYAVYDKFLMRWLQQLSL